MTATVGDIVYKLTNADGTTYGGMQWAEGVTNEATGSMEQDLCTDGWIHAYEHPLLAVLLNPIHAEFSNPILWEAKGKIGKRDGQLKCGCRKLTTIRRMELPVVTAEQRVRFAILCAKTGCDDPAWNRWADDWLSGKDHSARVAEMAWAETVAATKAKRAEAAVWAREVATEAGFAVECAARAGSINLIELAEQAMREEI